MVVFARLRMNLNLKHLSRLLIAGVILCSALTASADILFEGYSKVMLDGVHVGYAVQRYEYDPKKKEYYSYSFLKTNQVAGNITQSLRARANATFKPLGYQFTELAGDKPKLIDAQFGGETMTAKITENGKQNAISKKIPKNAFLSSFLAYVMLQGKEGLKKNAKYAYQAIAEEDAGVYSGEAFVHGEESVGGIPAFKVLNTFMGTQFVSYCTFKGEVLATRSPLQKLSTELVSTAQEATAGQSFNTNTVTQLFGSVPKGVENPVSRRGSSGVVKSVGEEQTPEQKKKTLEGPPPTPSQNPKTEGVPGGQGISIKGSSGKGSPEKESESPQPAKDSGH